MISSVGRKLQVAMTYADMVPATLISRLGLDKRTKYLFEDAVRLLVDIERDASVNTRDVAWSRLRALGLDDFGALLWSLPNPAFPKLTQLLPSMASVAAQKLWTGNSGMVLLRQGLGFLRAIAHQYQRLSATPLEGASILDFGVGYGRIARLAYYYTDENNFVGVDPWEESLNECARAGITKNILLSDYLPSTLPVGDRKFDVIYGYSVFTHLSERAALSALKALRRYIQPTGVLTLTIRPIEYWQFARYITSAEAEQLEGAHRSRGFAFRPHPRTAVDGDVTYGDTSMTLDWLQNNCGDWTVRAHERRLDDRMQAYVFLTPR